MVYQFLLLINIKQDYKFFLQMLYGKKMYSKNVTEWVIDSIVPSRFYKDVPDNSGVHL